MVDYNVKRAENVTIPAMINEIKFKRRFIAGADELYTKLKENEKTREEVTPSAQPASLNYCASY